MNPLLFILILGLVITLALVACVRAITGSGRERLLWLGVVALIAAVTLSSYALV
jgi:hypothetical protein